MKVLTLDDIKRIESVASDILSDVNENVHSIAAPVEIEPILKKYGIKLKEGEFDNVDYLGAYDRKAKTIYISKSDPVNRQAFTIAHELGHYFLHENKKNEIYYRTQAINISDEELKEEQEANWFAASLLMPEFLIKRYWGITKDTSALGNVFGVSPSAVYFRLKNLSLISE